MTDNEKLLWTLGIAGGGYYLYRRSLKPEDLGWYGATVGGAKRRAHTAIEAEAERVDAFLSTAELEVNKQKAKYKKQFEDRCKTNLRRVKKMLGDVQDLKSKYDSQLDEAFGPVEDARNTADDYINKINFPPTFRWKVVRWMIYNAPSYFYRDLRRELTTAISAYQVASTALDNALNPIRIASTSISLSITNALWIVPEVEGWCLRPSTMIEEVCRDNLVHSTRRRMFKRRKGGEFAKWNEVCDLYRQGSRGSYSYFKWPRKRDEDGCTTTWLGITQGCRMPESMRAGKNLTLYEEGCLADESCASDRFGMSSRLTQIASMPASIENVIYDEDRSIAALWAAIDSLADEAAELLGEVRKHLLAFWRILRRPSTKAHFLTFAFLRALWDEGIRDIHPGESIDESYRRQSEWYNKAVRGMASAAGGMRSAKRKIISVREELPAAEAAWESTGWKTTVQGVLDKITSGIASVQEIYEWSEPICDLIYPARSAEEWRGVGVPEYCMTGIGSYIPVTPGRKIRDPRTGTGRPGVFFPGGPQISTQTETGREGSGGQPTFNGYGLTWSSGNILPYRQVRPRKLPRVYAPRATYGALERQRFEMTQAHWMLLLGAGALYWYSTRET